MNRKVLVADDDESVRRVVSRALSAEAGAYEVIGAENGLRALDLAASERPDLILLDLDMPVRDGWSVLKDLRLAARTKATPIILVTGNADLPNRVEGLGLGADDILAKPFALEELRARVGRLLSRAREAVNPLTLLPAGPAVEEEAARRLRRRLPFAFLQADIDHFKPYNDRYGFARGDSAIQETAKVLQAALERADDDTFLGHTGGDDFTLMTTIPDAASVAQRAARFFDLTVPDLYDADDFALGFVESHDSLGHRRKFSLMRLSMAIVTTGPRGFTHYGQLVEAASELKLSLKTEPERGLSRFAFDRRAQ